MSRITVQIYLSNVEEGGATTVYSDVGSESLRIGNCLIFLFYVTHFWSTVLIISAVPQPGLVFLFDHAVLHDGELVTAGRKYAIRTEVMYND